VKDFTAQLVVARARLRLWKSLERFHRSVGSGASRIKVLKIAWKISPLSRSWKNIYSFS